MSYLERNIGLEKGLAANVQFRLVETIHSIIIHAIRPPIQCTRLDEAHP